MTATKPTGGTTTKTDTGQGKGRKLMRHIVALDDQGRPTDTCLCGHLWDRVFLPHGEEICQACVDELKRKAGNQ